MQEPVDHFDLAFSCGVRIEPIGVAHTEAVQRFASDPAVIATTNLPEPYPDDGAAEWIQNLINTQHQGDEHAFAMISEKEGFVGVTALVMATGEQQVAELGYWVGHPFWGQGYATGANRLVLGYGFEQLDLRRIIARPLLRNRASCRVLEKLGFQLVGKQHNPFPRFDPDDYIGVYALKRWQWRQVNRHKERAAEA